MDADHTPQATPPRPPRDWVTPTITLFAAAALGVGLYVLFMSQREVNAQFAASLREIQTAQSAAKEQPAEDNNASQQLLGNRDSLSKSTAATNEQLANITNRLAALEKNITAEAPHNVATDLQHFLMLKSTVQSGKPYQEPLRALAVSPGLAVLAHPLNAYADAGIATETNLRARLHDLLQAQTGHAEPTSKTEAAPHAWEDRLNHEFGGLLHISHRVPNGGSDALPYATLRTHAEAKSPLSLLIEDVENLPPEQQKPFTDWLKDARIQQQAEASLAQLETALAITADQPTRSAP